MGGRSRPPVLRVSRVDKHFPGVQALKAVSLEVFAGEVLALIGENGAGKSTLIKIIGGIYQPDSGTLEIEGREVQFRSVQESQRAGIAVIHQELNLVENLSIAENIYLGRQPRRTRWGLQDRRALERGAANALERVGLDVSPSTRLDRLSPGQKQLVEIAKSLSQDAKLLIFDEPTSSLSTRESERLFALIDELRNRGLAVVYISHRLGEISRLSKRVQVLRDGEEAGFLHGDEITHEAMVRLMVGRQISSHFGHERRETLSRRVVLSVRDLRLPSVPHAVSLDVHEGEILGLGGLVGAGRSELVRAIFGVDPIESGEVYVDGEPVPCHSPRQAIAAGILLVPEDRKTQGLIVDLNVGDNVTLAALARLGRFGIRRPRREADAAAAEVTRLGVRPARLSTVVKNLSGGNQQKIVLGKWLSMGGRVLILDEPTRGVDVGAKEEIYHLMSELARDGLGILMVSSEMEELIAMSDRIVVLHERRLAGELCGDEMTEENVLTLGTGGFLGARP